MRYIEVEQTGSPVRRRRDQRETLTGLKLNKIGRVSWLPDTPATRGMIDKVQHLVKVTHDPAAPRIVAGAPAVDETADLQLLRDLICDAQGIVLEPYDKAALNYGKTPDFKLMKDGELVGYCEVKSLFDPGALEDPPEGAMAARKNFPFWKDLIATIAGLPLSDGNALFMLGKKMQGQVCEAARKVDLFLWIDATTGTCQHLTAADAKHRATALRAFGLSE